MRSVLVRCSTLVLLCIFCFPSLAEKDSEYRDFIQDTPEYRKITTPRDGGDDDGNDRPYRPYHPYHYPVHPPVYRTPGPYYRSADSAGAGLRGLLHLGVSIGRSEFDYDDIDGGDASLFLVGYRPEDSRLGYELSFFDSGDSEVTSLSDIEIEVRTFNLVLSINSSKNYSSRLNLFGKGGIYFARTTLFGPFDSVRENSNGFLAGVGIDIMLNRHFGLKAEACQLFDVEDFADDRSVSFYNLGGQFVF